MLSGGDECLARFTLSIEGVEFLVEAVLGRLASVNGTADGGGTDYTASDASLIIGVGTLSESLTLTGQTDNIYEEDETIIVDVTGVTNGSENGEQQVTATITEITGIKTSCISGLFLKYSFNKTTIPTLKPTCNKSKLQCFLCIKTFSIR